MVRKYNLLLAILIVGSCSQAPSQRSLQEFVRADGTRVFCPQPPPDMMTASTVGSIDAVLPRVRETLKAQGNLRQTYERIRSEVPGLQRFEVLHYRLCVDYANGVLNKKSYQTFLKILHFPESEPKRSVPDASKDVDVTSSKASQTEAKPEVEDRVRTSKVVSDLRVLTVAINAIQVLSDHSITMTLGLTNKTHTDLVAALDVADLDIRLRQGGVFLVDNAGNKYQLYQTVGIGAKSNARHIMTIGDDDNWLSLPPGIEVSATLIFAAARNVQRYGSTFSTTIPIVVGKLTKNQWGKNKVRERSRLTAYFRTLSQN